MNDDQKARAAFKVECAERHLDAMKTFRNKKQRELGDAERALDFAYDQLSEARAKFSDTTRAD